MKKSQRLCDAQTVVEKQATAINCLRELRNHRTIQTNPKLLTGVQKAWNSLIVANAYTCVLWFPDDTHEDVGEYLPPLDAA